MANPFGWLQSAPSLLFGQREPSSSALSAGEDIPLGTDTPVGNILPGKVVGAKFYPWGGQVDIQTVVNGIPSVEEYLHLDTIGVQVGQMVGLGQIVGLSGGQLSGGVNPITNRPAPEEPWTTGPHIKFGLFQYSNAADIAAGKWGAPVNPSGILAGANQALNQPNSGSSTANNPFIQAYQDLNAVLAAYGGPGVSQLGEAGIGASTAYQTGGGLSGAYQAASGAALGPFSFLSAADQLSKVLNFVVSWRFAAIVVGAILALIVVNSLLREPVQQVAEVAAAAG